MGLSDKILALKDRTLGEFITAHDYYADTKFAWNIVRNSIDSGAAFSKQNATTGTITTQVELLAKAQGYVEI